MLLFGFRFALVVKVPMETMLRVYTASSYDPPADCPGGRIVPL